MITVVFYYVNQKYYYNYNLQRSCDSSRAKISDCVPGHFKSGLWYDARALIVEHSNASVTAYDIKTSM